MLAASLAVSAAMPRMPTSEMLVQIIHHFIAANAMKTAAKGQGLVVVM